MHILSTETDTSERLEALRVAVDDVYVPLARIAAVAIHDEGDMAGDWACGEDAEGDAFCVLAQDFGPPSEHSEEPGEHVYRGNAPSSVDLGDAASKGPVMRHTPFSLTSTIQVT